MDRQTYARMILADRDAARSLWSAVGRSFGRRNLFTVIVLVSILIGLIWIFTGMFPAAGGFLVGAACGSCALLIGQLNAHLRTRPWVDEFVDWKKVEEAADRS